MKDDLLEAINLMKGNGVRFEPGMSDAEFASAEEATGVKLPDDLKEMFRIALPVGDGFYNWRDLSPENLKRINETVTEPYLDILGEVSSGEYWCDDWGVQPDDINESVAIYKEEYSKAPKLVPIYDFRYAIRDNDGLTRVLSIRGTDTILFGRDLVEYFNYEFDRNNHPRTEGFIHFAFDEIPFWGRFYYSSSYMSDD